eukprot:g33882.t1
MFEVSHDEQREEEMERTEKASNNFKQNVKSFVHRNGETGHFPPFLVGVFFFVGHVTWQTSHLCGQTAT